MKNQGNASANASVVKVEVTHYDGSQFYTSRRYFRIGGLAAGGSTTSSNSERNEANNVISGTASVCNF